MERLIKIRCENNNSELYVKPGTSLLDLLDIVHIKNKYRFIAAYVNNKSKDLNYLIYEHLSVKFIDATHFEGARVYHRSLFFVLYKAVYDLYPECVLKIKHSVARGFYFEVEGLKMTADAPAEIKERMDEIVRQDVPILRDVYYLDEAKEIYRQSGFNDKLRLLDTRQHLYVTINQMANVYGYFYGTLAPSTGYVDVFDIRRFYDGFCLCVPKRNNPLELEEVGERDKLFDVFKLHKEWIEILDVSDIGSLNTMILRRQTGDLIKMGEAFQEKMFAQLADIIYEKNGEGVKVILISGPSSSGKTTFSKRLNIQLRVFGLKPVILSMDNYFVNREDTPLDEKGKHDYESVDALDRELFNANLNALIRGEEVEIPKFDFHDGKRYMDGTKLRLSEKSVIIIEGIHALNPILTSDVPDKNKFKIYVSALTSLSMDHLSRISTTDNRLLRRIVRDSKYRNHTALQTLQRWGSVRRGEEKNVFPFQDEADYMFNSALFYEISVLKRYAEPLLLEVPDTAEEYSEAKRLLSMLDFFLPIDDAEIPPTSMIREFIGHSSFDY